MAPRLMPRSESNMMNYKSPRKMLIVLLVEYNVDVAVHVVAIQTWTYLPTAGSSLVCNRPVTLELPNPNNPLYITSAAGLE